MLRLYDTATREVRELALREPGKVGIYLCGPTVYGPPHIGHGRATLVYDILRRYLESTGLEVRLVSNVTDIDDKIIDRAQREQRPWTDITRKCERMWFEAMEGINVKRPTDIRTPPSTSTQMVEMIGELIAGGNAYATEDGIYLSVETVDGYGLLAQQSLDDMRRAAASATCSAPTSSATRPTSCCGSSRSPVSRPGRRRGVKAVRAGTASAW